MGLYSSDLASLLRGRPPGRVPWRYQRIERSGATALITVTNGSEYLHHMVNLDAAAPPTAVPIEIASAILAQSVPPARAPGNEVPVCPGTGR